MGMVDNTSHISDDIAILLDDKVDKYHPGNQVFKLQALTGLQENSKSITTEKFSTSFLRIGIIVVSNVIRYGSSTNPSVLIKLV